VLSDEPAQALDLHHKQRSLATARIAAVKGCGSALPCLIFRSMFSLNRRIHSKRNLEMQILSC
jgi:hypothetical protein